MDHMEALVGQTLNSRFQLIEMIGIGGMSVVFRALDLRQQEVGEANPYLAVKVLKSRFQDDQRFFTLLAHEAKRSQSLSHPHIINVFDFDRANDLVFMTMELLEGRSLADMMQTGLAELDYEQRRSLSLQILEAVLYAHSHQVIHADIKPSNIFIRYDAVQQCYIATVIDFGISKALSQSPLLVSGCSPAYATPNTVAGQPSGPFDDAFGLGCVLYCLFSGRHPLNGEPSQQVESASRQIQILPQLSGEAWDALKRLILFPFYPSHYHVELGENTSASESALQQVVEWEQHLQLSLRPIASSPKMVRGAWASALILFALVYGWNAWSELEDRRMAQGIESFIDAEDWPQALDQLEAFRVRYGHLPRWSEDRYAVLIHGIEARMNRLYSIHGLEYDPVKAKEGLERWLVLFPDSDRLLLVQKQYAQHGDQSLSQLSEALEHAIESAEVCLQEDGFCRSGMSYYGVRLRQFHALAFKQYHFSLMDGYSRAYASAVYHSKLQQATDIREQALEFFDRSRLEALGMFAPFGEIQAEILPAPPKSFTTLDPLAGIGRLEGLLDGSVLLRKSDIASVEYRWAQVYSYLVAFQGTAVDLRSQWASLPVMPSFQETMNALQATEDQTFATGDRARRDPCWVNDVRQVIDCRDKFKGGAGPQLRSIQLQGDQFLERPYRLAVAQYELSWGDVRVFCQEKGCDRPNLSASHPVYQFPESRVEQYLEWLTRQTGFRYRLIDISEWQVLSDPLGLMNAFIASREAYHLSESCSSMGFLNGRSQLAFTSVYQGSFDRYGLYNMKDLSPEIVVSGANSLLVPGRIQRLRRCRIEVPPYEFPFATFRIVREVAQE